MTRLERPSTVIAQLEEENAELRAQLDAAKQDMGKEGLAEFEEQAREPHPEIEEMAGYLGELEDLLMDGVDVAEEKVAERREWVEKVKARLAVEDFDNPEEGT